MRNSWVIPVINAALMVLNGQDALTGLANRRCFDHALQLESARLTQVGMPLSLLMIDVDFFKTYNDRYGHPAGDECLQQVARLLQRHARRPDDLIARYGGEEFAILLPNTDPVGARAMAEEIQTALVALALPHHGNPAGMVTVSIGLHAATAMNEQHVGSRLVELADRALYAAKAAGRNSLCEANGIEPAVHG